MTIRGGVAIKIMGFGHKTNSVLSNPGVIATCILYRLWTQEVHTMHAHALFMRRADTMWNLDQLMHCNLQPGKRQITHWHSLDFNKNPAFHPPAISMKLCGYRPGNTFSATWRIQGSHWLAYWGAPGVQCTWTRWLCPPGSMRTIMRTAHWSFHFDGWVLFYTIWSRINHINQSPGDSLLNMHLYTLHHPSQSAQEVTVVRGTGALRPC